MTEERASAAEQRARRIGRARTALSWLSERPGPVGLTVFALLGLLYLGPALFSPATWFPGYGGDAEQYMWYLGWFWHALATGHNPLATHLFNYPYGLNLMWNTSILAESALLGPLALLFGTTFTYNIWFLANIILGGILGRALLRELGAPPWFAVLGGVLIETLPYVTTQSLSHISLVTTAPVLLGALILVRAWQGHLARRPVLWGILFGALLAFQFYTLIEVLMSSLLALGVILAVTLVLDRRLLRRFLRGLPLPFLAAAAVTAAIVIAPGAAFMFVGPFRVLHAVQPANVYVSDLLNFFWPTHAFLLHLPGPDPAGFFTGNFAEDNAYIGGFGIALLIFAARRLWHRTEMRIAVYSAALIGLLSMGQTMHVVGITTDAYLPWYVFDHVPLVKDLLPSRLMFYADILAVLIIVWGMRDWLRSPRTGTLRATWPKWCTALLVVSWLPTIPYVATPLPAVSSALLPGTAVHRAISGKPTFLLTPAFPEMMAALGSGGYDFPVANVYGHNTNGPQRTHQLDGMTVLLQPALPEVNYVDAVVYDLLPLHVQRLVFLPRFRYHAAQLPPGALTALYDLLGPPIASSSLGALVWKVPTHWNGHMFHILRTQGGGVYPVPAHP